MLREQGLPQLEQSLFSAEMRGTRVELLETVHLDTLATRKKNSSHEIKAL
jgi:hypothetical protein